jgi:hypothetical protein
MYWEVVENGLVFAHFNNKQNAEKYVDLKMLWFKENNELWRCLQIRERREGAITCGKNDDESNDA